MTVQEIVTRVRSAIDEISLDGSNFSQLTTDEQNLTRIIIDKIPYALQNVLEHAPLDKLDSDVLQTLTTAELQADFAIDATTLVATLKLPDDLLRIIEARLSSWSHFPIPEDTTSQVYLMQQDEYARGSWDRPVNILTHQGQDRKLEMYCAKTTSDTLVFTFIRKPDTDNIDTSHLSEDVSVPSMLEAALVYQVAGMTMVAFREDIANSLFAIANRHLGIIREKGEEES